MYTKRILYTFCTKLKINPYIIIFIGLCNIIALWIRGGWSIGAVLPAYVHATDGGDQNVGRVLCGLNPTDPELCTLPVRFQPGEVAKINWADLVVDFSSFPESFKIVITYLVASVVYHRQFLCDHLHSAHPLFASRFWRNGYQEKLKDLILGPVRMFCPITEMTASGVSQQTAMHHELRMELDAFRKQQQRSEPVTKENIQCIVSEVIRQEIKDAFQAHAVTPNSSVDVSNISSSSFEPLPASSSTSPTTNVGRLIPYANWNWGGQFARPLPENEHFPKRFV